MIRLFNLVSLSETYTLKYWTTTLFVSKNGSCSPYLPARVTQTAIVNSLEQSALQSCVRNLEIASEMYDEVTAFQRALPEMTKYDRYERRALSRRLRAIRTFVALQLIAAFGKTNPTLNS
jgi:hypothetical protein